jgi:tetratricopeptide (TPR) repeat protein
MHVLFALILSASLLNITPLPDSSDSAATLSFDERLKDGIEAFYQTDWVRADRVFGELKREYPDDPQPHFFSSMMPFWEYFLIDQNEHLAGEFLKRSEVAVKLSEQKLKQASNDTTMVLMLSGLHGYRSLVAAGESNYRVALQSGLNGFGYTRKLLSLDTERADARIGRGMFYYMLGSVPRELRWATNIAGVRGDVEQGLNELKIAAESDSYVSNDAKLMLMYLYNKEERYDEALAYADQLTGKFPKNVIFKFKKAEILENNGNKTAARELFREIVAIGNPSLEHLTEKSREKIRKLDDLTQIY